MRASSAVRATMETRVFTFELMGSDRLALKQEGTPNAVYLDDLLNDGWSALHWENVSDRTFVRYRAIMVRKKSQSGPLRV